MDFFDGIDGVPAIHVDLAPGHDLADLADLADLGMLRPAKALQ